MKYEQYLTSDWWKERRRAYLYDIRGCERCGEWLPMDVHHMSYDHLYGEADAILVALCRSCHEQIHTIIEAFGWNKANKYVCDFSGKKRLLIWPGLLVAIDSPVNKRRYS